jgi:hypothetical protein
VTSERPRAEVFPLFLFVRGPGMKAVRRQNLGME